MSDQEKIVVRRKTKRVLKTKDLNEKREVIKKKISLAIKPKKEDAPPKPAPAPKPKKAAKKKKKKEPKLTPKQMRKQETLAFLEQLKPHDERIAYWDSVMSEHSKAWRLRLPLKIGVRSELKLILDEHVPEGPYQHQLRGKAHGLRAFFNAHFSSKAYLENITKGGNRYTLEGEPEGEVTKREQEKARSMLVELEQGETK